MPESKPCQATENSGSRKTQRMSMAKAGSYENVLTSPITLKSTKTVGFRSPRLGRAIASSRC